VAITFGKVPHPAFKDRPITKAEGHGQNDLGQRSVKGVVWHRMIGTLWGTDAYFRFDTTDALTDYGIGVEAQDGATNDGVIIRWNDPLGRQSGWASGPVNGAYGDGLAFVNKYGVNGVNRYQASIEISGKTYDVPLSEKSRQAIAELTAYWADQYQIPWDTWPISDQDGFSFVRWHQEFCIGTGKVCPGQVVMDETNDLIERTRAVLKKYQESTGYAPVVGLPFDHLTATGWHDLNGVDCYLVKATVECIKRAIPRAYASGSAPQTADAVSVKEVIPVYAVFKSGDGVQWFLMEDGSRVRASSFTPAITVKKR
jgi:hypothetical protein